MTETVSPVRLIRRIRDIDGDPVDVGVDYDIVTISGTVRLNRSGAVRLNRQQRREFVKALAEAAEAVAAHRNTKPQD